MQQTVFVLGAGFSAPAHMPVQTDLMREIVKRSSQLKVRQTVGSLFNVFQVSDVAKVPLEDIFTALDRARNARETIPGFSEEQVSESYEVLISSIAAEFKRRLSSPPPPCYDALFSELIQCCITHGGGASGGAQDFSIFTLNWDTIPDYLIHKLGTPNNVSIDYGCHAWDLAAAVAAPAPSARHPASDFSLKLYKLHGSLNWLACSSCGRLFSSQTAAGSPPVVAGEIHPCPFCRQVDLRTVLMMPTLLKDFRNVHVATIWHRALLELHQAARLIFVGYSLPLADFEFRYLLLRGIAARPDIAVRVVLFPPDNLITRPEQEFERAEVERRYRNFFGQRELDFKYMNSADFMIDPMLLWHW